MFRSIVESSSVLNIDGFASSRTKVYFYVNLRTLRPLVSLFNNKVFFYQNLISESYVLFVISNNYLEI